MFTLTYNFIHPNTHCIIAAIYMSLYDYKGKNPLINWQDPWPHDHLLKKKKSIATFSQAFQRKPKPEFDKPCAPSTSRPSLLEAPVMVAQGTLPCATTFCLFLHRKMLPEQCTFCPVRYALRSKGPLRSSPLFQGPMRTWAATWRVSFLLNTT